MRKRISLLVSGILMVVVVLFSFPTFVEAAGLGVSPPSIEITDALRGNVYQKHFRLFNSDVQPVNIVLTVKGDFTDWVTFFNLNEPDRPTNESMIPGDSYVTVIARFSIPVDAVNGEYQGSLEADTVGSDISIESGSGQIVQLHTAIFAKVTVTGNQILAGQVNQVTVRNTEVGLPLHIGVNFTNTGNVIAKPVIKIKVMRDNEIIDEFIYEDTTVMVDSSVIIETEFDIDTGKTGDYICEVNTFLGNNLVDGRTLRFRILPRGGLSGEGELLAIRSEGDSFVSNVTKIITTFRNDGIVETYAKAYTEIYLDGKLIAVLDSEEIRVESGREADLICYFSPEKSGEYEIKVHAVCAGKTTNELLMSLFISDLESAPENSFNFLYLAIGIIGTVVVVGALFIFLRRKPVLKWVKALRIQDK